MPDCAPDPDKLYRALSMKQPDNYLNKLSLSYLKLG